MRSPNNANGWKSEGKRGASEMELNSFVVFIRTHRCQERKSHTHKKKLMTLNIPIKTHTRIRRTILFTRNKRIFLEKILSIETTTAISSSSSFSTEKSYDFESNVPWIKMVPPIKYFFPLLESVFSFLFCFYRWNSEPVHFYSTVIHVYKNEKWLGMAIQ